MKYISTRDKSKKFEFKDVFIKGLADDGGLFIPETLHKYTESEISEFKELSYSEIAKKIIHPSLGEKEILGQPIQYGENSYDVYSAAPNPGEHTVEILTWLGYEKDTIEKLRNINTIQ